MSIFGVQETWSLIRRCMVMLRGEYWRVALFVAVSIGAAATEGIGVSLLLPVLELGKATSGLHDEPIFGWAASVLRQVPEAWQLSMVAVALFAAILLRGLFLYMVQSMAETLPLRLQQRMMTQSYAGLLQVEVGYLSRNQAGGVIDAVSQLPVRVAGLIVQMASALYNGIVALGYTVLMLALSVELTFVSVAFFLLIGLAVRVSCGASLARAGERATTLSAKNSTVLHETINGLRLIRLAAADAAMNRLFASNVEVLQRARMHMARIRALPSPLLSTAVGAFICVLLGFGHLIFDRPQSEWVIAVLMFNVLVFRLLSPVSGLLTNRNNIASDLHAFDEYDRLIADMKANRQVSGRLLAPDLECDMRLEGLSFRYPGQDNAVLNDIDAVLGAGKMIALVGPTGSGKSTLAALVARLYDPTAGRILVDGVDLRDIDIGSWHAKIGVVSQDSFIFNDSLANNLRFVRPNASDRDLVVALERAAASNFLQTLPEGLETMLGERGTRLSGGQIQRVALARAILSDPKLLILDEATSALDSITEAHIQRSIEELRRGRTILVIAHRLSTIRAADEILVLESGRITQRGDHAQLMIQNGLYRNLQEHQSAPRANTDAAG